MEGTGRQRQQQRTPNVELDRRKRARLLIEPVSDESSSSSDELELINAPRAFLCPITRDVMYEPVLDGEGNTYERSALLTWLSNHSTSPVSRQPLTAHMVTPNNALRESIHEFMGEAWVKELKLQKLKEEKPETQQKMDGPKLRAKIDGFLRHTSRDLGGLELQLNEEGCCAFRYDSITIVLDVPANVGIFCLYTKGLVPFVPPHQRNELYQRALELNFLQGDTRGGCLSIRRQCAGTTNRGGITNGNKGEIMFSYTDRVTEISSRDFSNILLNFVETSVALRDKLLFGFDQPLLMMDPDELWAEEEEEEDALDSLDGYALEKTNTTGGNAGQEQPATTQPMA